MRDLLKHVPMGDGPTEAARETNEMLNGELERYAEAHGVDLSKSSNVGDGILYGSGDKRVYFFPERLEIGAADREFAEHYLKTGEKE